MICQNIECNKDFISKSQKQKYCCLTCANIVGAKVSSEKTREKYESNPVLCKQCSDPIAFEKRYRNIFCGSSCAASYNNVLYPKRGVSPHRKIIIKNGKPKIQYIRYERTCEICRILFITVNPSGLFCSSGCRHEHKFRTEKHDAFLEGKIKKSSVLRKMLVIDNGNKCVECKTSSIWNNKHLTLQVDHVDGNSDNNLPNNLRLLCPNCHSQTETFGKRNQGVSSKRNDYRIEWRKKNREKLEHPDGNRTVVLTLEGCGSAIEL